MSVSGVMTAEISVYPREADRYLQDRVGDLPSLHLQIQSKKVHVRPDSVLTPGLVDVYHGPCGVRSLGHCHRPWS